MRDRWYGVTLPDEDYVKITKLKKLLRYVKNSKNTPLTGRFYNDTMGMIYWPHVFANKRFLDYFADIVLPRNQMEAEAHKLCPVHHVRKHNDFITWLQQRTRMFTEHLLGSLLVPAATPPGVVCMEYAAAHGEPSEPMHNRANYTTFRRLTITDKALARVLQTPDTRYELAVHELPDPLRLIHHAWKALTQRATNAYDPTQVGIEYTHTGCMFINWDIFRVSSRWPKEVGCSAASAMLDIEKLSSSHTLRNGMATRDLDPTVDRIGRFRTRVYKSDYVRQAMSTDLFVAPTADDSDYIPSATVIDPLYLVKRQHLFDGTWHYQQRSKQLNAKRRSRVSRDSPEAEATATTKVYSFMFKPVDHLKDIITEHQLALWFDPNHEERVYGIRRKKAMLFTRPELLGQARQDCPAEVEVWLRAVDSLKLVESYRDDGAVGNIQEQLRSEFYKQARQEHLNEIGPQVLEHFVSYELLSKDEQYQVREAAKRLHRDRSGDEGAVPGRWWLDKTAQLAREFVKADTIRRIVNVTLPGERSVSTQHFYTPEAIKLFQTFTQGAMGSPSGDVAPDSHMERATMNQLAPTPYLLAWTRFCLGMQGKANSFAIKEEHQRWTPAEDIVLAQHIHINQPRMSRTQWGKLLAALPARNESACRYRARTVNLLLAKGLTAAQRAKYRMGNVELKTDQAMARKTIFIYGYLMYYQRSGRKLLRTLPGVRNILKLTGPQLERLPLPTSYAGDFFSTFGEASPSFS
jgi:hypothetical protein